MSISIVLLADEQEALKGLPWPCWPLYIELRSRMDFATGRVGAIFAISWQALREALYQEPHRGIPNVYPHKEAVRRLARWLERRGLIVFQSNPASGRLIFFLPLAHRSLSLVQKKADRETTGSTDRVLQRGKHTKADRGKTAKADTHPGSVPTNTTTYSASSIEALQWPPSATAEEKALVTRAGLNGSAQAVIDEWAAALQEKRIQKRTAYLATLVNKAIAGRFAPDRGKALTAARDRAQQARSSAPTAPTTNPPQSLAAEALRKRVKGKP